MKRTVGYKIPKLALRMVREGTVRLPETHLHNADQAAACAVARIGDLPTEHLIMFALDGSNRITSVILIASGGMSGAACRPSDILRAALAAHACGFVLAHNHPSGDPTPSPQDITTTRAIREAAAVVGLPLVDHVVVTRTGAYKSIPQ